MTWGVTSEGEVTARDGKDCNWPLLSEICVLGGDFSSEVIFSNSLPKFHR